MARPVKTAVQREFAYWYATPKRLRVSLGLPLSETQFAEMKDITPRTLRRWKEQVGFKEMVESFKLEMANDSPDATIRKVGSAEPKMKVEDTRATLADDPALTEGIPEDEQKYLQVKDTLVRMAMDGNQGAMDLYLKHYGKAFVEAEQSDFADYRDLSDEQLVAEVCQMAGVEAVSGWLAERAAATV